LKPVYKKWCFVGSKGIRLQETYWYSRCTNMYVEVVVEVCKGTNYLWLYINIRVYSCKISDSHRIEYEDYCLMRRCDRYPSFEGTECFLNVGNISPDYSVLYTRTSIPALQIYIANTQRIIHYKFLCISTWIVEPRPSTLTSLITWIGTRAQVHTLT
jgi:hypothetical protein